MERRDFLRLSLGSLAGSLYPQLSAESAVTSAVSSATNIPFEKEGWGEYFMETFFRYFPNAPKTGLIQWVKEHGNEEADSGVLGNLNAEETYGYAVRQEFLYRLNKSGCKWWNPWVGSSMKGMCDELRTKETIDPQVRRPVTNEICDTFGNFILNPKDDFNSVFCEGHSELCDLIEAITGKKFIEWSANDLRMFSTEIMDEKSVLSVAIKEYAPDIIRIHIRQRLLDSFGQEFLELPEIEYDESGDDDECEYEDYEIDNEHFDAFLRITLFLTSHQERLLRLISTEATEVIPDNLESSSTSFLLRAP